ncbi:hypothetical protein QMO14_01815 [Variovorax sp. CAN2819]|uniref:hypothetical protein n=1 Tax=Variovorax sp. CAN15 TaxID=3046727 RepID=UPI00264911D6|nr:hypothetical protein [Variovorax sp. CAN15]MDN6882328.1 hypothetical protein [Variovorax sp. CAN15]
MRSSLLVTASYDTPCGAKVEGLADVAQLFMGGYLGVEVGRPDARTLTVGTCLACASDTDVSLLGSTRKLLMPALGDSVALERMAKSGVAIIRTGEMSYAQLGGSPRRRSPATCSPHFAIWTPSCE